MQDMMHIVLSSDANYGIYMGVTIFSALRNKSDGDSFFFHILDGGIASRDKELLMRMIGEAGSRAEFIPVDDRRFDGMSLNLESHHVTIAAYYRLFIPTLLDIPRCIYLDCDMIIRGSLMPLWQTDLHGSIAAGVPDINADLSQKRLGLDSYVNSGMLLMDIDAMRKENIQERCLETIRNNPEKLRYHDQDVLNMVLRHRILILGKEWNCQICKTHKCRETGFFALRDSAPVLHYIGHRKPWHRRCRTPKRLQFWLYLQQSPWAEAPAMHAWHVFRSLLRL